jgi:O-antigen/teichoic acid export membrane protein
LSELSTSLGSRAVLNTALVLAARIVSRLIALVIVVVLANHLGGDGYGRYTTLIAYSALVSVVADLGLNPLYTREAARDPARLSRFLTTVMTGKLALAAAASLILAGALTFAGLGNLLLPGAVLLALTTYASLLRNTFYAVGRLEFEVVAILGEIAIQAALILFGARSGKGVSFFVWAYAASYGFTCAYALIVIPLFRLAPLTFAFDLDLFRSWLRLAYPFAVGSFLTNLYFKADVPILQHFKPFQEVGWYQFAYKPFESLQFIPLAIQTVVYPLLGVYYRESAAMLSAAYARFFKILLLLGWPLSIGTFVLVHPVGRLFRLFPQSEPSLRILALAIVFLFVNSAFTAMLYAIDRQDLFAWATGIAVVINLALNFALIPLFGYLAASATTVVTEAAFSVAGWWFVGRRYPLPWFRLSWRVVIAGLVMGAVLVPLAGRSIFVSVPVGGAVYAVALWLLRAVERDEVDLVLSGMRLKRRPPARV